MIYATYSLVILALILCSAFFSLAEMSFLLASPVTLRHWAEDEDNRSAAVALGMLDDANRVLTTINIGDIHRQSGGGDAGNCGSFSSTIPARGSSSAWSCSFWRSSSSVRSCRA